MFEIFYLKYLKKYKVQKKENVMSEVNYLRKAVQRILRARFAFPEIV